MDEFFSATAEPWLVFIDGLVGAGHDVSVYHVYMYKLI